MFKTDPLSVFFLFVVLFWGNRFDLNLGNDNMPSTFMFTRGTLRCWILDFKPVSCEMELLQQAGQELQITARKWLDFRPNPTLRKH